MACIPAWQSAPFIERTLSCVRRQTHEGLRILISIDKGDDETPRICARHARWDRRISVFDQPHRLGWAGNVNFLLDRVDTEYFFLYFHDDIIAPDYTRRLLDKLHGRPDAMSVHCDMGHFGGSDHLSKGVAYSGIAADRLLRFFVAPVKGSPLRSLTRSVLLESGVRLPTEAEGGLWANQPYLMDLIAAGPVLHVPEVLYRRWDQRAGGLTDGWRRFSLEQVISGFRVNARCGAEIVCRIAGDENQRELLTFGLYLYVMSQIRQAEAALGVAEPLPPESIHASFRDLGPPACLSGQNPDIKNWTLDGYRHLRHLEAVRA